MLGHERLLLPAASTGPARSRPADQPARLEALVEAVHGRTRDRAARRASCSAPGSAASPTSSRTRSRSRSRSCPGWPAATAPGHVGRLLLGRLGGVQVAMLQGRFHLYEGNDAGLVVQPVLLFRRLGAEIVILTNAAGGVNPDYGPGTLMVIADHLNLTGRTPLLGAQRRRARARASPT